MDSLGLVDLEEDEGSVVDLAERLVQVEQVAVLEPTEWPPQRLLSRLSIDDPCPPVFHSILDVGG